MSESDISVVRYKALLECVAAYFGCTVPEIKEQEGFWEWEDWEGNLYRQSMKAALVTLVIERKVWGWLEDKHILHIWIGEDATPEQIIEVVAHELGHSHTPFHRDGRREEQKAAKYARVAMQAFDMMNALVEGDD